MSVVFFKLTGSGNDFVMVDGRSTTPADWPVERIRAICDRRDGIGADGLWHPRDWIDPLAVSSDRFFKNNFATAL